MTSTAEVGRHCPTTAFSAALRARLMLSVRRTPNVLRHSGTAQGRSMDTVSFFLIGHGGLHSAEVAGETSYADRVFGGLTDDQMRARPGKGLNSLVWLLWHMARTEDVAVNLVVAGRPQLLDDWLHRLDVPWRTIGTGMTDDEVSELTAHADVAAVRAYRSAVDLRTREVVTALRPEAWDEILGIADTAPANAARAFARGWVDGVGYRAWQGHSRAAQLASSAIAHNAMHLGEAITVRSQAGFGLGI